MREPSTGLGFRFRFRFLSICLVAAIGGIGHADAARAGGTRVAVAANFRGGGQEDWRRLHLRDRTDRAVLDAARPSCGDRQQCTHPLHARDLSLALHPPEAISIRNILSGTVRRIVEEPETAYAEAFVDVGGDTLRASLTRASVAELGLRPGLPVLAMVKSFAFDGPS